MTSKNIVELPSGSTRISVSLINPVNFGPSILSRFMAPMVPGLETFKSAPSFSFLLEHPSGRKLVWDLGIRKDYLNYSKSIAEYIPTTKYNIQIEEDVGEILEKNGLAKGDIEAVIWSHWHWDHIGNPATFPHSTKLIVGRGFKEAMLPGYPSNPQSPIRESDYEDRDLVEIEFDDAFKIGKFPAFDYFGDGSFYLLDSPGHAVGHMCGLARTTLNPSTFILLGGDICHYAGIFRPSQYLPVPESITPNPCLSHASTPLCPGHAWEDLQRSRGRKSTDPLFDMTFGHDVPLAMKTKEQLQELDCNEDVFVIIAHDSSVRDWVDHYPQKLDEWKAKGWGQRVKWDFFRDLDFYWKENNALA